MVLLAILALVTVPSPRSVVVIAPSAILALPTLASGTVPAVLANRAYGAAVIG